MGKMKEQNSKLQGFWEQTAPVRRVLRNIGKWIYHLRSVILSIPVVIAAIWIALENSKLLPKTVGINLLADGQYQWMVARNTAVMLPLVITGICLLMMFCSRRVVYPWLISVFSLILPALIYFTNVFPA